MSKKIKKGLVPELRFPEFRDLGEWEQKPLGHMAVLHKGKGISKPDVKPNGSQPCIRYGELYTLYGDVIDKVVSKTDLSPTDLFLSNKDDVIIPASGETKIDIATAACVKSKNIALGGDLNIIRSNQNGSFLSYQLNGVLRHDIAKVAQGDTVVHLYKHNLEKLTLSLPSPEEQQKIADCLSSLDDLITVHIQKHEALQSYKKSLMQNLFPTEGETVPVLRLPEFKETANWEAKPLHKIFSIFQGFAFSSKDAVKEGVRWLKIADVSIQTMNHNTPSFLPAEHTVQYERHLVKKGDHVVALTRPILNGRLKMAVVDNIFHGALLNQRVGKLIALQDSSFVYYLLQTSKLINDIKRSIAGSEPPNLSARQIEDISTHIPSKDEQKRIADSLSSVDDLIAAQDHKIEELKAHKKGLMQQLFTTVNEEKA